MKLFQYSTYLASAFLWLGISHQAIADSNQFELRGELKLDGNTVAKPNQRVEENLDSYLMVESRDYGNIRLTINISSQSGDVIHARFLLEQEKDSGWEPLMQPLVTTTIGEATSVTLSPASDSENPEILLSFTVTRI